MAGLTQFGLPGSYDYDGDCGVSMQTTTTAQGSQTPVDDASTPHGGATENQFDTSGKNIVSPGAPQQSGYALGGVPD